MPVVLQRASDGRTLDLNASASAISKQTRSLICALHAGVVRKFGYRYTLVQITSSPPTSARMAMSGWSHCTSLTADITRTMSSSHPVRSFRATAATSSSSARARTPHRSLCAPPSTTLPRTDRGEARDAPRSRGGRRVSDMQRVGEEEAAAVHAPAGGAAGDVSHSTMYCQGTGVSFTIRLSHLVRV